MASHVGCPPSSCTSDDGVARKVCRWAAAYSDSCAKFLTHCCACHDVRYVGSRRMRHNWQELSKAMRLRRQLGAGGPCFIAFSRVMKNDGLLMTARRICSTSDCPIQSGQARHCNLTFISITAHATMTATKAHKGRYTIILGQQTSLALFYLRSHSWLHIEVSQDRHCNGKSACL
jgi:hypothetical protein